MRCIWHDCAQEMTDGRQHLTPTERADIHEQQDGRCISCGRTEEEAGRFIEEHTIPNYFRPGKPDALMCECCHVNIKTPKDRKDIAKCKRLLGETGQRKWKRTWPPGRKLQGRAFSRERRSPKVRKV